MEMALATYSNDNVSKPALYNHKTPWLLLKLFVTHATSSHSAETQIPEGNAQRHGGARGPADPARDVPGLRSRDAPGDLRGARARFRRDRQDNRGQLREQVDHNDGRRAEKTQEPDLRAAEGEQLSDIQTQSAGIYREHLSMIFFQQVQYKCLMA